MSRRGGRKIWICTNCRRAMKSLAGTDLFCPKHPEDPGRPGPDAKKESVNVCWEEVEPMT